MPDEICDADDPHNEDTFNRCETWIISINESGDAKGKREIKFHNPTEHDLYLNKTIDLEFDKPAYGVKYEGIQLAPIDKDYLKYTIPKLTDKVDGKKGIKKTIEFEYQNFATDKSKYKRVRQFLSKDILDSPIETKLTYQLPYKRFFGRFAYIVDYDKNTRLRFNRKEQKFTFKSGPIIDNNIIFDYRPRPVLRILGITILIILLAFFGREYFISTELSIEYVVASISLAIICGIAANSLS